MTKYSAIGLILLGLSFEAFAEPSGAAFLKIPNGATEISLGLSGVSHSKGGSAAFWNPARVGLEGNGLGLQFFRWLGDGRGTFGTASFQTSWGGIAAYIFDLGIDGFEARDVPGPAIETFTVHQSIAAIAAAIKLPMNMRAGLSIKGYLEDIYGDVANQFPLIDAGLSMTNGKYSFGVAGSNFTLNDRMDSPMPVTGRAGITRKDRFGDYSTKSIFEMSFVRDLKGTAHLAIEGGYKDFLFLRCGAAIDADEVRPTFGLGLEGGPYRIDAATALYDESLGSTWRVGLGYRI